MIAFWDTETSAYFNETVQWYIPGGYHLQEISYFNEMLEF